ncbi:hypothetical protein CMV_011687 [Castanea mollissima]|uniref:Lipid-binding serum glycoprotein C-terminal domain-containing protein n=1 Tax=Castanea mollissima TaxID=60419 RepID=A0A8J4RG75_9ROSI|nr:hypothetical protein CMV_011687 [Castanea mollissima]
MAPIILLIVLSFLFTPTSTQIQSNEEGFISVTISEKGLDFAKDVLIDTAISSIIPLQLPDIEKFVKIPLVGKVYMLLSNITIFHVDIASSYVNTGETDDGDASVQVEGMEVGVTASLKNQGGNLKLSVLECGCHVKYISIKVNGGASWLYQGVVDAFEKKIATAVENAISKKIREGIIKLDSSLQSIPKQVPVYSIAFLNVTFVDNPVMINSSIEFEINGLVTAKDAFVVSNYNHKGWKGSSSCSSPAKMIQISLQETFFNSISLVYFDADYMHWIFDNIPDQSILNTAGWRYIVPQLYEKYPNDDMNLNISVSSPPIIKVAKDDINAFVNLDVTIDVIDSGEAIPAACISLEISTSGSAEIVRNNLAGSVRLKDFSMYLKWSEIGDLQMNLLQPVMSTILKTVFLPYVNSHLRRGFPLPILHGFTLQDAEIVCTDSTVIVYSDLASTKQYLYAVM